MIFLEVTFFIFYNFLKFVWFCAFYFYVFCNLSLTLCLKFKFFFPWSWKNKKRTVIMSFRLRIHHIFIFGSIKINIISGFCRFSSYFSICMRRYTWCSLFRLGFSIVLGLIANFKCLIIGRSIIKSNIVLDSFSFYFYILVSTSMPDEICPISRCTQKRRVWWNYFFFFDWVSRLRTTALIVSIILSAKRCDTLRPHDGLFI